MAWSGLPLLATNGGTGAGPVPGPARRDVRTIRSDQAGSSTKRGHGRTVAPSTGSPDGRGCPLESVVRFREIRPHLQRPPALGWTNPLNGAPCPPHDEYPRNRLSIP